MNHRGLAALSLLATTWFGVVRADDACSDVLRIGLHDVFASSRSDTLVNAVKEWACSSAEETVRTTMTSSAKLIIEEIPVGGDFNMDRLRAWRTANCGASDKFFSTATAEKVAINALSQFAPDAIAAWRDCVTQGRAKSKAPIGGRVTSYPDEAGSFVLNLTWGNVDVPGAKPPRILSAEVSGASCPGLKPTIDFKATGGEVDIVCTRKSTNKRVIVTINTSQGPVRPAPTLAAVPPGKMCGVRGNEVLVDTSRDRYHCGGCGCSCGSGGVCEDGYCRECTYTLAEIARTGTSFTQGSKGAFPVTCRARAGEYQASLRAEVWVNAGRHTPSANWCNAPTNVTLELVLNGASGRHRNMFYDPADTGCAGAPTVLPGARALLKADGELHVSVNIDECDHDGPSNPCVFRSGTLQVVRVGPASDGVAARQAPKSPTAAKAPAAK